MNIYVPCKAQHIGSTVYYMYVSISSSIWPFLYFCIILFIGAGQGVRRPCLTNYWGGKTMLYNLLGRPMCPTPMLYHCFTNYLGGPGRPCRPLPTPMLQSSKWEIVDNGIVGASDSWRDFFNHFVGGQCYLCVCLFGVHSWFFFNLLALFSFVLLLLTCFYLLLFPSLPPPFFSSSSLFGCVHH